jgi:hypothetical protein
MITYNSPRNNVLMKELKFASKYPQERQNSAKIHPWHAGAVQ